MVLENVAIGGGSSGTKTYTKWKTGFGTVALSVSNGSRMSRKPNNHNVIGTINSRVR
jgi:hypothetical protein